MTFQTVIRENITCVLSMASSAGCVKNVRRQLLCLPRAPAGPIGASPFIVLQKKPITMLMCHSGRLNPEERVQRLMERARVNAGLTAKRRLGIAWP